MLVAEDGPAAGVPVLLLHGWPDTARLWRNQADVLGEAGYRVLAPDLVGRGGSHRPSDVARYRVMASVGDMINLLDNAGIEQAHLVGHDWGASVAWAMALTNPHRVHSLTALSVGHPNAWEAGGAEQLRRSWYMFLFQFEGVAEELLVKDDWAMFRALADDHSELTAWIADLSRPFALTASLNWYRANARAEQLLSAIEAIQLPVDGGIYQPTASIGGCLTQDVAAEGTATRLVDAADQQLYRAKSEGRNRVRVVTSDDES